MNTINNRTTHSPKEILEAIRNKLVKNPTYQWYAKKDAEPTVITFEIDGMGYECIDGKIRVCYDFELDLKDHNALHILAVEENLRKLNESKAEIERLYDSNSKRLKELNEFI